MIPVVLRRQFTPGAALAWLSIVFLHPYFGGILYLLVGESRLGRRRGEAHRRLVEQRRARDFRSSAAAANSPIVEPYTALVREVERIGGMPVVGSNSVELVDQITVLVERLVSDIDAADSEIHLCYFMFAADSTGQRVTEALIRAAARGVKCRIVADAVASRPIFRHGGLAHAAARQKLQFVPALPVAPIRRGLGRMDFRNHRKLAVIDSKIGYVGSHNLINADYGGSPAGPWFDLTARYEGPIVRQIATVFADDWAFETGEELTIPSDESFGNEGGLLAQVAPTGPGQTDDSYRKVFLAAIHCARRNVTLTSPYFVPDEPSLVALEMAADRGVDVTLVVPEHPDHAFTAAAGRARFQSLLASGVAIWLFQPGLIHAKTTTVDDALAIVGSANLDVRSFMLNFELGVVLYGSEAVSRVREFQTRYQGQSRQLTAAEWSRRPIARVYADRALSLLSPLL
jgi:cardiolipin synthase